MSQMAMVEAPEASQLPPQDNVTDWCLEEFQSTYQDTSITKDDIWEYLYGVMHAPDWRERYGGHLQKSLPRVPLAPEFEPFRAAGRALMDLHVGYETCPEHPDVVCEVDGIEDDGKLEQDVYRIHQQADGKTVKMKFDKTSEGEKDFTRFKINDRCVLTNIPLEAQEYTISGRSPLEWAADSLRFKPSDVSDFVDNPNLWHVWAEDSFELVKHLRRLVWVSTETVRIVNSLPASLPCRRSSTSGS